MATGQWWPVYRPTFEGSILRDKKTRVGIAPARVGFWQNQGLGFAFALATGLMRNDYIAAKDTVNKEYY